MMYQERTLKGDSLRLDLRGLFSRRGGPSPDPDIVRAIGPRIDIPFYLAQLPGGAPPEDPAHHYHVTGWREGLDPNPDFSTRDYLLDNPDVAEAGVNPLYHLVAFGEGEGRHVCPSTVAVARPRDVNAADPAPDEDACGPIPDAASADARDLEAEARTVAAEIEPGYYSQVSGLRFDDALAAAHHYCATGWQADLDPSPTFSTRRYLEAYHDVAAARVNPFWHFISQGRDEGRIVPEDPLSHAGALAAAASLEEIEAGWLGHDPVPSPSNGDFAMRLRAHLGVGTSRLIVAFSHDDFRNVPGGVQVCIADEVSEAPPDTEILVLRPARPRPRLAPPDTDAPLLAILGERDLGSACAGEIVEALSALGRNIETRVVIHHLLGHRPEDVAAIALSTGRTDALMWLHDYLLLCPSYALQRNSVTYCGAPEPGSTACRICLYGQERTSHLARLEALFQAVEMHVIAPSEAARRIFEARTKLPYKRLSVLPHMDLVPPATCAAMVPPGDAPARIAFVGTPARHKGWSTFQRLAERNAGRAGLEFLFFGLDAIDHPAIEATPLRVTPDDRNAMVDALRGAGVDLVVHWASWPETFSFSTFEALAAGAYVLANPVSGNVAATVERTGRGRVLPDEAALFDLFESDDLQRIVAERRAAASKMPLALRRSGLSHDLLPGNAKP